MPVQSAVSFANSELSKWRPAMFVPAIILLIVAALYWKYTSDCPKGNYDELPDHRPQKME